MLPVEPVKSFSRTGLDHINDNIGVQQVLEHCLQAFSLALPLAGSRAHEIAAHGRAINKKAVPGRLRRRNDAFVSDGANLDFLDRIWESHSYRQTHRLGSIIGKYGADCHHLAFTNCHIHEVYCNVIEQARNARLEIGYGRFMVPSNNLIRLQKYRLRNVQSQRLGCFEVDRPSWYVRRRQSRTPACDLFSIYPPSRFALCSHCAQCGKTRVSICGKRPRRAVKGFGKHIVLRRCKQLVNAISKSFL